MNLKHTVLLSVAVTALTACVSTGDQKPDTNAADASTAPAAVSNSGDAAAPPPIAPAPQPAPADAHAGHGAAADATGTAATASPTESAPAVEPPAPVLEETTPPAAPAAVEAPRAVPAAPAVAAKPAAPRRPTTVVLDNAPKTFNVTVDVKDASHPNFGLGANLGFVVDGVPGKELALSRGVTYTFAVRTGIQHDFYFTTSPIGHGAGTVTDGVVGQFIYNGDARITPTAATPSVIYYECRNHKYMGGKIHVAAPGERVVLGLPDESKPKASEVKRNYTAEQVKQKLGFADMVIEGSASAKRVAASDNAEAKQLKADAKRELGEARAALGAGDNNAAMDAVDAALRLMHSATTLVPAAAATQDDKARYAALLEQVRGFEVSYKRNLEQGMKPKAGMELDANKFRRMMADATGLADKEQHAEAIKQLEAANDLLTASLSAMLDSQTVVYEKNFATPKDEYEYELARYNSYAELVPVAIEQRRPAPQTFNMMGELTKRAQEIHDEGVGLAKKGDHKMAIMAMQAATERVQRALRLAGVQ